MMAPVARLAADCLQFRLPMRPFRREKELKLYVQ
jgi:hypothetical protein